MFWCHLQHAFKHAKTSVISQKIKNPNNSFDTRYRAAVLMLCCNGRAVFSNLCYIPNQARGSPSPTPVIPGAHRLCQGLRGWKDSGKKVELPFFWTNHTWIGRANFILLPHFKKGKNRWHDTVFPFLFHIVQLDLPPVTEARGSTSQSSPGTCSSSLHCQVWSEMIYNIG